MKGLHYKFSPFKQLLIDIWMLVFNEIVHSKNAQTLLKGIDDYVFSFGDLRSSFGNLISDFQWEKKAAQMGHVFIKGDTFKLMFATKKLKVLFKT